MLGSCERFLSACDCGEMGFQSFDDRGGRGIGSDDDLMDSAFAQGGGSDRTNGGDSDFVLEFGHCLLPDQIRQVMDGAGAEEDRGVSSLPENFRHTLTIDIAGRKRAIGDDFGQLRTELFQGGGQIGISAVAARQEHVLMAELGG